MKSLSADLLSHLSGTATTLALCWTVRRRDGVAFSFTDHDQDLTVGGTTYKAAVGYQRTELETQHSLDDGNTMELTVVLDDAAIAEPDLRAGLFTRAAVEVSVANWAQPAQGTMTVVKGWLGEVEISAGVATVQLYGLEHLLTLDRGETVTPTCRADFGDDRCGKDLDPLRVTAAVSSVVSRRTFNTTLVAADRYFDAGNLTWTSGANADLKQEVRRFNATDGQVQLYLPMPFGVEAGDAFTIVPGCAKSLAACKSWSNVVNFRGEPHVPGNHRIFQAS